LDPEPRLSIVIEAAVSPSEDPGKVMAAVVNVVGDAPYEIRNRGNRIQLSSNSPKSLARFRDQLRDRGVRSAARRFAIRNRSNDEVTFMLNRQAAYVGVIVLCGTEAESPLGPIYLTVESRKLDSVVDWLTAMESG
jgi:uncharacterized protein